VIGTGAARVVPPVLWVDRRIHGAEVARFESYVVAGPDEESCSLWCAAIGTDSYGRFYITRGGVGRCVRPNRYALALATGITLTPEVFALHECDNPFLGGFSVLYHPDPGVLVKFRNEVPYARRGPPSLHVLTHATNGLYWTLVAQMLRRCRPALSQGLPGRVSGRRYADRVSAEITVRGSFASSQPPERGTVHASISYEGPSMEPVYTRVARDLDVVQTSVKELKNGDAAAVTWWSAERLRTWSTRPWNQDGKQLPLVHHASVGIEVKFRDFAALSAWVGEHVTNTDGFHVTNIKWALTVKRRDELIRQVRKRAVHDAIERAQLYADALELGKISPVAIADAGMLVANLRPDVGYGQVRTVARAGLGQAGHGSGVELVPEDVEVAASVDARFVVEGSGSGSSSSSSPADTKELRERGLGIRWDPNADPDVGEFRDDDAGYLAWLAAHPDGYVINILRSHSATDARVHHAGCWTISGENPSGKTWTGPYVKVCAEQLAELDQWAINQAGEPIARCGTCRPASDAVPPSSIKQTEQAVTAAVPEGRCEIHGPAADSAVVEAWADHYIRFEHRPPWQEQLRDEIRSRCRQLEPSAGQVLHATFFGAKHPNADVENVLLYYIDSFRVAGRNGIRFEHGIGVPTAPDGAEYRFCYRYALAPRSGTFTQWRQGRTLASFDWTDLGAFGGEKKLAQVWLALKRAQVRDQVDIGELAAPETPFAVRVQVRAPRGSHPVWGGLVKGTFDGVICALQAHTDTAVLPEVVARLAKDLPADPGEIEEHLLHQCRAVLGAVHRLVSPYGAGVKWDPSDHLCVAGELLAAEPVDDRWAITGEIFELSR
jgi:uncharacterized protein YggE